MAALKGSYQALLTFALLGATGMAPSFVEEQVLKVLAGKTTAVMTNVPGAQQARYFAGQRSTSNWSGSRKPATSAWE
jgi:hypothetical protein